MQDNYLASGICSTPIEHVNAEFAELVQSNRRLVSAVIRGLVHSDDVAEDLTQEVLLRALERSSQYNPAQGNLSQWLTGIARHQALDYMKAERHRALLPVEQEIDASPGAEASLLAATQNLQIRSAINNLDQEQREIIQLAYFQDLSQSAIAARLRKPLGTVKGRMRAAMRNLRDALRREDY